MERIDGFMRSQQTPPLGEHSRRIGPADAIVVVVIIIE
jgi:hypothetical protein